MSNDIKDKIVPTLPDNFVGRVTTPVNDRLTDIELAVSKLAEVEKHLERNIDAISRTIRRQTEVLRVLHVRLIKLEDNDNVE